MVMMIRALRYYAKEASKNVFANGWMSLASIFTVVASLLIFGIFLVLIINVYFWIVVKDVFVFIYQSIPYVISFLLLFVERHIIKKQKK